MIQEFKNRGFMHVEKIKERVSYCVSWVMGLGYDRSKILVYL